MTSTLVLAVASNTSISAPVSKATILPFWLNCGNVRSSESVVSKRVMPVWISYQNTNARSCELGGVHGQSFECDNTPVRTNNRRNATITRITGEVTAEVSARTDGLPSNDVTNIHIP